MSNKKKYDVKKENMDTYTFEHSLWKRLEGKELSESQINFLSQCLTENLEHARHAENERLTFNNIFLALVAGAMAFAGSLDPVMSAAIYLFLTIAGFLSIMPVSYTHLDVYKRQVKQGQSRDNFELCRRLEALFYHNRNSFKDPVCIRGQIFIAYTGSFYLYSLIKIFYERRYIYACLISLF